MQTDGVDVIKKAVEDRHIVIMTKCKRRSALNICAENKNLPCQRRSCVSVHCETSITRDWIVWSYTREEKETLLKAVHRHKILQWAREHKHWTVHQWKQVLWTDEFKWEMYGSNHRQYVLHQPGERVREERITLLVKHGGIQWCGDILVTIKLEI